MAIQAKKLDFVLCERMGPGEFQVVDMDDRHYVLKTQRGNERIYKVHCHITPQLSVANHRRRVERAEQIGRPRK